MTRHDLAPGYVKIFYSRTAISHTMTLGVKYDGVPASGADPTILKQNGTGGTGSTLVSSLITLFKPLYNAEITFTHGEFWYKANSSASPVFIHGFDIAGGAGTWGGATVVAGELVMTFRTQNHNLCRLFLMESVIAANAVFNSPTYGGSASMVAIHNFVVGATNWIYARDNSYPITGIRAVSKINDPLRRRLLI